MKSDIAQVRRKTWKNNFERLNRAIQVHVKDGVLIVPHSGIWPCYLVTDEEDPIVTRIRLNLLYCGACSCPGLDSRLHSDCRTDGCKVEKCRSTANGELAMRKIVKHVAFPRMRLAPGVFVRANVGGFAKIAGTGISTRDYITRLNQDAVRHAVVNVAAVVVWWRLRVSSREKARERIYPGAGPDAVLVAIQA